MVNAWVKACKRLKPGMNVILQLLCCLWKGKLDLRKCWTFFFLLTASFVWRFSCILSNSPVTGWRFRFIFIQRSNFRVFRPDRTSVSMHSSIETGWVHCRKYAECIQSTKPTGFFLLILFCDCDNFSFLDLVCQIALMRFQWVLFPQNSVAYQFHAWLMHYRSNLECTKKQSWRKKSKTNHSHDMPLCTNGVGGA